MSNQLTSNAEALRLFITEDIYLVNGESQIIEAVSVSAKVDLPKANVVLKPTLSTDVNESTIVPPSIVAEAQEVFKNKVEFEFLGKNQKGILILVNDAIYKVSSPQGTELLRKLVKAISLTNNDFALVNYAKYPGASYQEFFQHFSCKLLLSFGIEANILGLEEQSLHQLNKVNGTTMVFTSNLHDLDSDTASKKILWGSLQKLNNG